MQDLEERDKVVHFERDHKRKKEFYYVCDGSVAYPVIKRDESVTGFPSGESDDDESDDSFFHLCSNSEGNRHQMLFQEDDVLYKI